ncbi:hypothetical protein [Spiroplasma floricola]|uniref:Uncharacterized protein n=1 Tax=Spiroplasma floricola 23-6 TaxID=1336749 RepID=A0A2K8SEW5_9MOLU|nr:hypothetical protein [Spiroplasma floricola]AUB31986.1 hypothetical protein SFLOR_v1c09380 [Spiroplasma floricola 23-6]
MDQKNSNNIDLTKESKLESEKAKKRLEEIKLSNDLINSQVASNNFYVPKRKTINSSNEEVSLIKPRKKKNLPFTDQQQKELEKTISDITNEYKDIEKEQKNIEKKLLKEEVKISRLITKTNRRIRSLIDKEDMEQLEKSVDLQEQYIKAFDKVQEGINTLVLRENNISLGERRKYIYNKAYNAETERARRLVELRNSNKETWASQIKKEKQQDDKRPSENWRERLGIDKDK